LPERLYLDNGSEYNGRKRRFGKGPLAGVIEGFNTLSALNLSMRELIGEIWHEFTAEPFDRPHAGKPDQEQASAFEMLGSGVTRAQPYNAPGKSGIEGAFASLEKVMAMLDGHIGGDRMKKKTPKLGKETPAWHSESEFKAAFNHALDYWNNKPQAGNLNEKSPYQAFQAAIDEGWKTPRFHRAALIYAMSETIQCTVQTCGVVIDGKWYENSTVFALKRQQKATFRVASWAPEGIIYAPNFPDPVGMAWIKLAKVYDHRDLADARDASARNSETKKQIADLRAKTGKLDLSAEMARHNAALPPAPETPFNGEFSLGIYVDELVESVERLEPPAPPEIVQLQPGESVDRETGEVTHGLDTINPPRRRRTEERDPFAGFAYFAPT
jgi:hypothetical protein